MLVWTVKWWQESALASIKLSSILQFRIWYSMESTNQMLTLNYKCPKGKIVQAAVPSCLRSSVEVVGRTPSSNVPAHLCTWCQTWGQNMSRRTCELDTDAYQMTRPQHFPDAARTSSGLNPYKPVESGEALPVTMAWATAALVVVVVGASICLPPGNVNCTVAFVMACAVTTAVSWACALAEVDPSNPQHRRHKRCTLCEDCVSMICAALICMIMCKGMLAILQCYQDGLAERSIALLDQSECLFVHKYKQDEEKWLFYVCRVLSQCGESACNYVRLPSSQAHSQM